MNESQDLVTFVPPGAGDGAVARNSVNDSTGLVQARIAATIQVRTMQAIARPRDLDVVRERLLKDARRAGFAEAAEYAVPRGSTTTITGPSIRFVEAALAALGNVTSDVDVLSETDTERFCEVTVADLERNTVFRQGFVVNKTVERRRLPDKVKQEEIVGTRTNSEGEMLYIIKASESDVMMKQNAAASKIIRTLGLRLLPGDIRDEALDVCAETRRKGDAADPDAAKKKLADAFAVLGVRVDDLKEYLGHPLAQSTPTEMESLRKVYTTLREGTMSWVEIMEQSGKSAAASVSASANSVNKASETVKAALLNKQDKNVPPSRSPAMPNVASAPVVDGELV